MTISKLDHVKSESCQNAENLFPAEHEFFREKDFSKHVRFLNSNC